MKTNGKKICFLGDSITEGCGASAPEKNFVSLFAAAHPKTAVHNCGVGGTRIAPQKTPFSPACAHPFYSRVSAMPERADLVCVFGGTNDYGVGDAPLGKIGDRTEHTFYGALYALSVSLLHKYPSGRIVFFTPLHRAGEEIPQEKPDGGKILKDGVTNGKEICLDNTGKFYTPSAGISASTLLASGVKDIWGTADPLLIQDGQKVDLANQQKINNTYYNRTAIGMVQPGEYYMITAGTAQYKNGLSFAELQSIFANLGCTYARSMDGGGSSSLVVNGKLLNTPAQYDERPVVDFLSFLP